MKAIKKRIEVEFEFATEDGEIKTLEGVVSYKKGDAIITGIKGEKYPCRRDIFDETYEVIKKHVKLFLIKGADMNYKNWYKWIGKGKYMCKCGQEVDSYRRMRHIGSHLNKGETPDESAKRKKPQKPRRR